MKELKSTALFFHNPGDFPGDQLDYQELTVFCRELISVKKIWNDHDFQWKEQNLLQNIKANQIERIVIAGKLPGTIKTLFSKVMSLADKDPGEVYLACFNNYGIRNYADMDRAKGLLTSVIEGIPYEIASKPEEAEVNPATLIIGGGIAGIQASLEIASSSNVVYLVEKSGTIGGKMATFDKTFPTLDCAACILTPKMVEVNQNPNIRLFTCCEVTGVSGKPGSYVVKILKHARRVNVTTCIGCGTCSEKCPVQVSSEFDSGTTTRKAIYIPFPQAVPNKYLVDPASCIYLKNGKCKACLKACPVPDCINLDEKESEIELTVGNIIIATGYKPFDAKRIKDFGYGFYPNVITSLEFERLVNASGPTGGNIHQRGSDKKGNLLFTTETPVPEKIAIIHCVGSRDKNYNKYCSRVCCMYSLKFAHLVLDKIPEAEVFEYFIDMRAFGKGYEEFYKRILDEGVNIIRGKTAKVIKHENRLRLRGEDILQNRIIENDVDMVILSVGLEPGEDTEKLSRMFGIPMSEGGWFEELNYNTDPTGTYKGGIHIAGCCQGPKDIPDSVSQGSAAAARVLQSILRGRIHLDADIVPLSAIQAKIKELSIK